MEERQKSNLRQPAEETVDLYPGLSVCDDRVSGSITVAQSRLPLWAFIRYVVEDSWEDIVSGDEAYYPGLEAYGWTEEKMSDFLYYLMQCRGEFGRLLLLMAEVNRLSEEKHRFWMEQDGLPQRMKEQLQRCLATVQD